MGIGQKKTTSRCKPKWRKQSSIRPSSEVQAAPRFIYRPGPYYYYGTYLNANSAHAAIAKILSATSFAASIIVCAVTAWQSSNLRIIPSK
jgi:hypothetical protein